MIIVEEADPRSPGPRALLEASHALMKEMFPPEENYFLDIEELCDPDVAFFAARRGDKTLGTGALAMKGKYAEVKSMFTSPEARGKGVAAAILRALEDTARARNIAMLKLETGDPLDAAVRLYERAGFTRCAIFGDYAPNSSSVYMEKPLN
ncbi:MAG: GNAT family N-acetyltransferase [Pseudomonadota bacterium]